MPAAANGAAGTDGELIVIDGDVAYNFWQFSRTSSTTAKAASFGAENIVTGDGWGSKSPFLAAGITAVGASQLGGLIVKDETNDGSIDHALQLVVDAKLVLSGAVGQAISSDGSSASGIVKEGQLLAIPPGTPMPAGLSPLGQQVFKAMQQYGAYVVDVAGGVTNVRAQANAFDGATMTALWHDMGSITPLLQGVTSSGSSGSGGNTPVTEPPVVTNPPPVVTNPPPVTTPPTVVDPPTNPTSPAKDATSPTLQWVAANGASLRNGNGTVRIGDTVFLTLKLSEAVNVTGTPTLALSGKGTANYVSGTGTDTLQFEYKVAAGQNTNDLAISGFNLAGVKDLAGNALNLSGAPRQPAGKLVVDTKSSGNVTTPTDTTAPKVQWIAANGAGISDGHGSVKAGDTVRLAVNFNEVVTVNGSPTLSLNSKGTAKYAGGSGTNTLQFDYVVGAGEKASDLEVAGYNLKGVTDRAGNAVNIAGAPHQPGGVLAVGAASSGSAGSNTQPEVQWIAASGSGIHNGHGTVGAGDTVWLSVNFKNAMLVDGTPTLSLSSGGTAKYDSGAGTSTLQFKYVVGAGETAPDLEVSGYNLGGVTDRAGNAVDTDGAPHQPGGVLTVKAAVETSAASSSQQTAAAIAPVAELAAPAALTAPAAVATAASDTAAASQTAWGSSFGPGDQGSGVTDFTFGNSQSLGYSGSQDGSASSAPSQETATARLALLNQYAASSFATPGPSSLGTLMQAWWGAADQTLAKPRG